MSDIDRLVNLYWAIGQTLHFGVDGDVIEVGCHAGGTSIFLQMLIDNFSPGRELHLYDSFQGMPEPGPRDAYLNKGDRPSTSDQVRANFEEFGLRLPHIHEGWFEDTLPDKLPSKVAAAYFDGDFYDSIMMSLSSVWPRLSPDGIIIIDDYADIERAPNAFAKLPGVKLACDDFFADKDAKPFVLVGGGTLAFAGVRKPRSVDAATFRNRDSADRPRPGSSEPTLFVLRMVHLGEVDEALGTAHRSWVESNYDSGLFVASGPADGGGVALAVGGTRRDLDALLTTDPVVREAKGRYEVTECTVSLSVPQFGKLLDERAASHGRGSQQWEGDAATDKSTSFGSATP